MKNKSTVEGGKCALLREESNSDKKVKTLEIKRERVNTSKGKQVKSDRLDRTELELIGNCRGLLFDFCRDVGCWMALCVDGNAFDLNN